jgi:hypothetical protein
MRIISAIYAGMAVACAANIHEGLLLALCYLALAECYRRAYGPHM